MFTNKERCGDNNTCDRSIVALWKTDGRNVKNQGIVLCPDIEPSPAFCLLVLRGAFCAF